MNNGQMRSSMATDTDKKIVTLDNLQTFLSKTDERYLSQLSDYVKTADMSAALATKVDAEPGKMLSQNDFTDQLLAKLQGMEEGANRIIIATTLGGSDNAAISQKAVTDALNTKADKVDLQNYAKADDATQGITAKQLTVQKIYHGQDDRELITEVATLQNDKADKSELKDYVKNTALTTELNEYAKLKDEKQTIQVDKLIAEASVEAVNIISDQYHIGDSDSPLVLTTVNGDSENQTVSQKAIKTELSSYAKLVGGNTFTGMQTLTEPSGGYSINAEGYIKGSWGQFTSTGKAESKTERVCVLDTDNWIYYRTPAEIISDGGGAKLSDIPTFSYNSSTKTLTIS